MHSARPVLLGAVVLGLVCAVYLGGSPSEPAEVPMIRVERSGRTVTRFADPADPAERPASNPVDARVRHEEVTHVATQCDLQLTLVCGDDACAVMGAAPDLDGPGGWVRMVWNSPRFAASTALRDLGVPATRLPCGDALDGLLAGAPTRQRVAADGGMVWCAGPIAVCDAGAAQLGHQVESFAGARELFFDR